VVVELPLAAGEAGGTETRTAARAPVEAAGV
jgi:hypothetical protein